MGKKINISFHNSEILMNLELNVFLLPSFVQCLLLYLMLYSEQTKQKLPPKSERNHLGQNAPFGGTWMKFPVIFCDSLP